MPTLGQVASLLFISFAGWYVDQALEPTATATMLMRAIPASVSGIMAVVRQELMQLGLQVDLVQLVCINGQWLYRFEKVLSLEGLVVLAVLVYDAGVGVWRPRPFVGVAGLSGLIALTALLGWGNRLSLSAAFRESYHNDERLMALTSSTNLPMPLEVRGPQPIAPVSLAEIKRQDVLRVGIRSEGLPWAYRNREGRLVGLDVDLMPNLARDLGVRLQLQEAPLPQLETWLREGNLIESATGHPIRTQPGLSVNAES